MRRINLIYTTIYGILGALIISVELYAVAQPGRGDTISEHYWWAADQLASVAYAAEWLLHIPLLAGLGWLAYHLVWERKRRPKR